MRAGWILIKIRHKQYGVNVDEVGADIIRPHNPISDAMAVKSLRQCLRHCHLPFQGRQIGFKISAPLAKGDSPQCGEMSRSDRGDGRRLGGKRRSRRGDCTGGVPICKQTEQST